MRPKNRAYKNQNLQSPLLYNTNFKSNHCNMVAFKVEASPAMWAFRAALAALFVSLTIYTGFGVANDGLNLFPIFFSGVAQLNWAGQMYLDLLMFMTWSALWTLWRNGLIVKGGVLTILAFAGGMTFMSLYLLILTFIHGDLAGVLLGTRSGADQPSVLVKRGFQGLLVVQFLAMVVYTGFTFANDGFNLFSTVVREVGAVGWSGQFILDLAYYLILSTAWVAWRHKLSLVGIGLAAIAAFGGATFLSAYLFVLMLLPGQGGDGSELLLGKVRAQGREVHSSQDVDVNDSKF